MPLPCSLLSLNPMSFYPLRPSPIEIYKSYRQSSSYDVENLLAMCLRRANYSLVQSWVIIGTRLLTRGRRMRGAYRYRYRR